MRRILLFALIVLVSITYLGRLLYLQIIDTSSQQKSLKNTVKAIYDYPERGFIYDRNGTLMVANQPTYDLMIIPKDVKSLDTTEFCKLINIKKEQFDKQLKKVRRYSTRIPSVFVPQLSKEEYAYLQEKLHKFNGFYIQKRSLRDYQSTSAANVLGYISEANTKDIKRNSYYQSGDLIGRQGVEKSYEKVLRGVKGVKYIQKDRFNRDIGPYENGKYDTLPQQGKDILITIDQKLQEYGEQLMANKRGGIIAIEPKTGEILALVTAPSYNPELLVGRIRSKNFNQLYWDSINKPLYDRALLAEYPPGSPFKVINALIGLQEGIITKSDHVTCNHGYYYGKRGRKMGCHCGGGPRNLNSGIYLSCNAYFANCYRKTIEKYDSAEEGIDNWAKHAESFGLGNYLGYDLPIGKRGNIPDSDLYNRYYPNHNWYATNTLSNAIGQGEVLTTPIQLANMTATIANRGYYYTPHIIKKIEGKTIDLKYTTIHKTSIDSEHFEPVIEGLFNVYNKGTARYLQIKDIEICGKTGTAENFTKIDGKRVQLTDHSIFTAFAPKDDPQIAIAVFVENGYWGSRWAGPIASLMIEKYIKGKITRKRLEEKMFSGSLEEEYAKPLSGESFIINR